MEALRELGIEVFVELGPTTTLLGLGRSCLGDGPAWIPSLRKGRADAEQMMGALGRLFTRGVDVDWRLVDVEPSRRKVALPTYPWQRERYWVPTVEALAAGRPEAAAVEAVAVEPVDGALYGVRWTQAPEAPRAERSLGAWMILCDRRGVGEALAAECERRGVPCVKVYAGAAPVPGALSVEPSDGVGLARLWREAFAQGTPRSGVVHLWGLDAPGVETPEALRTGSREACTGVVSALRALESSPELPGRLWMVTRDACPVEDGTALVEPAQTMLWGLGRVAALEHPERWGGLVDVAEADGQDLASRLWDVLQGASGQGEDQVVLRGERRFVPRLVPQRASEAAPVRLDAAAAYLVTGGQGELGLQVARWMVHQGARHLVLTARKAFPGRETWDALVAQGGDMAARILAVRELEAAGATVVLARADVSRREEMASLLERVRATMPALRGVVHAAGVSTHARLQELDTAALDSVLAPKVEGAWNLHALTRGDSLDFFVLFSSISAVWGSTGSGHYAAANAFLDALAHHRRALGLPAMSINWGPWAGRGMASPEAQRWLAGMGVDSLEPGDGMAWFARLLGARVTQATVARVRWERFKPVFEARGRRPFLDAVGSPATGASTPSPRALTSSAGREDLAALVRQQVAGVLGLDPKRPLPPERGFADMGMDSLMAVELKERLQDVVGQLLPATLAFNYPNVQTLTDHLWELVGKSALGEEAAVPEPTASVHTDEPIAIIGMACRFPGEADSPEAYWRLLRDGVDAISEIPADRWDVEALYDPDPEAPGKMYVRMGGFLRDVDGFEPQFFGISPREAESMDPQQRLLLEVGWEALEHAGVDPEGLRNTRTGVFVGLTASDYARVILNQEPSAVDAYFASGTSLNVAAGRLSFALGLQGPSMAVDTACSSSLVALHLACQSLRNGESTMALSGGVNLILSPEATLSICKARMLSPEGRCKTFDASADGFARGEGCGVLVLKRLSDARADGNRILAVIRGSAVNHDGPSSGLTVPNGLAQQAVIRQALESGGVAASEVSYLEAHGTGTSLGDPIEVDAMWAVLGEGRQGAPLWMGSAKTNLGHLESAAGVAAVMKVVLALQHKQLPPHLHFKKPNPHIAWERMAVEVPTRLTRWEPEQGRRLAGVSSFGLSGTNAHVLLEGAPEEEQEARAEEERPKHVLVLSARTEGALEELARRYVEVLGKGEEGLGDICFTAGAGRAHLEQRLAVVGASAQEVRRRLEAVVAGQEVAGVVKGQAVGREKRKVAFLFTGQGSQYEGMGRELYQTQPVFRAALERCAKVLEGVLDRPLLEVLYPPQGQQGRLDETRYTQPALFALEYALAQMWKSWGVEPDAVMGHSVGEYVAAVEAGVMELEDGLRLVAERGRLMQGLKGEGAMVAVEAEEEWVKQALEGWEESVSVAARNGPRQVVVAGERKGVEEVVGRLEKRGVKTKKLKVSHAFHSPQMEPMLEEFERKVGQVKLGAPRKVLISNVTGKKAGGEVAQARYWREHVRQTVRFAEGMEALGQEGVGVYLEVGPSPVLVGMGQQTLTQQELAWVPTLRKGQEEWGQVLEALSALYVRGVEVAWAEYDRPYARRTVSLPTYPFQRRRHWHEESKPQPRQSAVARVTSQLQASAELGSVGVSDVYSDFGRSFERFNTRGQELYLHWAPLREVPPGFSWLKVFYPDLFPEDDHSLFQRVYGQALRELRQVTYRAVDFSSIRRVLDIGCGYSSDLIDLARAHSHLKLDGYNITLAQVEKGNQRVKENGLQERIRLFNRDSSRDEFPDQYELIQAFQVIHHIEDKRAVLANIQRHLANGGLLVASDIVSTVDETLHHEESEAHLLPRKEWAQLFAEAGLRIIGCVDLSQEISNFFGDREYDAAMARLKQHISAAESAFIVGPHMLGKLLGTGLAQYLVLTLQKDPFLSRESLLTNNRRQLEAPQSYADIVAHVDAQGRFPLEVARVAGPASGTVRATAAAGPLSLPADPLQARRQLQSFLEERIRKVLQLSGEDSVPFGSTFISLGFDSFTGLQLKNMLEKELGLSLPMSQLFEDVSLEAHVDRMLEGLARSASSPAVAPAPAAEVDVDSMSEEEINARLRAMLHP
jgi:acyl transferase domain-containing protein/SAM-dependent methyltransferase/acyl carrier protein